MDVPRDIVDRMRWQVRIHESRPAHMSATHGFNARGGKPKLLDLVRQAIRVRQYSPRTEEAYVGWIRRYVRFHDTRHPSDLDEEAVAAFLTHLANAGSASAATQNQASSALLFLYRDVLRLSIKLPQGILRPSKPRRLPIVLTRPEVRAVLAEMSGLPRLIAQLLYGSGLRLMEAMQLRVKDVHLDRLEIVVRDGKGGDDRITMLPAALRPDIAKQIEVVKAMHEAEFRRGGGYVPLPDGMERKSPRPRATSRGNGYSPRSDGIPTRTRWTCCIWTARCCSCRGRLRKTLRNWRSNRGWRMRVRRGVCRG
jgi:integrase